jgi:uncharacterized protein
MTYPWGHTRRYNDFSSYIKQKFNRRVQKISINAGFTCPNRDGSKGVGGCYFCNNDTFKPDYCEPQLSVKEQIVKGIDIFKVRYPDAKYMAYFQSYTNTYGDLAYLIDLYEQALENKDVVGLIVGTRPDCLPDELLSYFADLSSRTYVTIELGVESTNNQTLKLVNRGHDYQSTIDAVHRLHKLSINVGAHLILGLPGESRKDIINNAIEISKLPINYLKIHQLQYVKGSELGRDFMRNSSDYKVFDVDEYVELVVDFLEVLKPEIVMERFASQAPQDLLLAPRWGLKNFELVHMVEKRMIARETWQGRLYI